MYEFRPDGLVHDTETGELMTQEAYLLHVAALNAAQAFADYDRARLDMEALNTRIAEMVAEKFPELGILKESVSALKKAYACPCVFSGLRRLGNPLSRP